VVVDRFVTGMETHSFGKHSTDRTKAVWSITCKSTRLTHLHKQPACNR